MKLGPLTLSLLISTVCCLPSTTLASPSPTPALETIYQKLIEDYPTYNGITYAQPETNYLSSDGSWVIQTPNAWGQTLASYKKDINTAAEGQLINTLFRLPTCDSSSQCSASRSCTQPVFSHPTNQAIKLCTGNEDAFQVRSYDAIISAKRTVDITTLQPSSITQSAFSTDAFTPTLQNALVQLAVKANINQTPITVRLLQGGSLPYTTKTTKTIDLHRNLSLNPEKDFIKDVINSPYFPQQTPYFDLYVGTERSCYLLTGHCDGNSDQNSAVFRVSWNHGKIIDVDHQRIITGGENFWGSDYLESNPVNDLNLEISGPVTEGADTYINTIWNYLIQHQHSQINSNICASYHDGKLTDDCPSLTSTNQTPHTTYSYNNDSYPVKALFVSKLNNGVLKKAADASELARVIAFKNAKNNIKISQQALYFKLSPIGTKPLHPIPTPQGNTITALATALSHNVQIDIVTSNLIGLGISYTSEVSSAYLENAITTALEKVAPQYANPTQAKSQVEKYLTIKTIQYAKNDSQGNKTLSHDKLWIVDDNVFYIGSHNLYPSALQQFGVIIEDDNHAAVDQLESQLWNPLWKNSKTYVPTENNEN